MVLQLLEAHDRLPRWMCIEDTRIESICIRVIYIVSVVSPLPLLLIGITFYISLLFLSANELRSEGIILKNRYRKTFANKITNSRLNIRHISRRLDQTDRTLRVIYIYGNDFCEHTQNAPIPSVECFVITIITICVIISTRFRFVFRNTWLEFYNNYEINSEKRLDQDRSQNSRVNEHESANKGVKCRESKKKKSSQANFRKIKISPDRISF